MVNQQNNKKKKRLLKATVVCILFVSILGSLFVWHNINSYKESEKIINDAVAKQLNKKSKSLTSEDYKKVEYIDIGNVRINNLKPIEKFKNFKSLKLVVDKEIDLRPLEKLHYLKKLDIFFPGQMSREPTMFENLRHRISHPSGNSRIASIAVPFDFGRLEKCKYLECLIIHSQYVKNIAALAGLTNMKHLEIETDYFDMKYVSSLINLEYLAIRKSVYLTNISSLANHIYLQELDLSDTKITDANEIKKLTGLKKLNLTNVSLTDEQIAEIQKALPELKIVR